MSEFFNSVINGTFDFKAIGEVLKGFFANVMANPGVSTAWGAARAFLRSLGVIFPIILLVLSAIELFFGKKLMSIQRFLLCAAAGYGIGVVIISPMINNVFPLPDYVSGAVIAIVMAVLCKYIYFAAVAVAVGYSAYIACINPAVIPVALPTHGNLIISLVVAAVAILVVFLLLKYVEMLGTSVLGAFCITRIVIIHFFDYRTLAFLANFAWIVDIALIALIALIGFIVQIKTRKRY